MAFFAGAIVGDLLLNTSSFSNPLAAAVNFALKAAQTIGSALGQGFSLAADFEQSQIAFQTMLGSAEKAKTLLGEINQFAAATPFESPELVAASRQLLAFGISAQEVVPTLRQLGDISAGVGKPIGEIAYLFGTAKVQGRLFQQDINQFTNAGIPIITELAKVFGVTESAVRGLVEQGKVGFPQLQQAIDNLTSSGGRFAGLTEAQSHSLAGLWSTLKDNVGNALRGIAESIIDAFDIKGGLSAVVGNIEGFGAALVDNVRSAVATVKPFVTSLLPLLGGVWEVLKGVGSVVGNTLVPVFRALAPVLDVVARVLGVIFDVVGKVLQGVGAVIGAVTNAVGLGIPDVATESGGGGRGTGAGGGAAGAGVNIQNLNVAYDPYEASSQVAQKILPEIQRGREQQARDLASAAKHQIVAAQVGGRP